MTTTPPEPPAGGEQPGYGTPPGYGATPPYGGEMQPGYGGMSSIPNPPGGWVGPPLAEWPHRVGASLIDGLIIGVPYMILSRISLALAYLVYIGLFLYLQYMQGTTGQTPGKKVLKLKLLKESDGTVIGFGAAVGRALLHIVDAIPCLVGYLWPIWDKKKQTFADKIIGTVVIKDAS